MQTSFMGYRRENGRVGVRNHVINLPVDDLSNAAAECVANNIKGTMAIPHPYGRLQFGADLELHFRTLIGAGSNPNVAAVALGAKSVIFGDFGAYFVRIAGGVRFERSTDFAFNADQITFKAVLRGDGILADQTGAVKVFVGNAA